MQIDLYKACVSIAVCSIADGIKESLMFIKVAEAG